MAERTCVVCRKVEPKATLLRFVIAQENSQAALKLDGLFRLPGRGAYCHESCVGDSTVRALIRSLHKRSGSSAVRECSVQVVLEAGLQNQMQPKVRKAVERSLARLLTVDTQGDTKRRKLRL
jgi:predicted RNA-binding protein YlxR (DUF448 family)